MKSLEKLFLVILCFGISCSQISDELATDQLKSGDLGADKTHETKMVTVPFEVDYTGTYVYGPMGIPTDKCQINVFVEGAGTGTHVGNSTIYFDFCVNPVFEDDVFVRGEYGNAYSYIVAANGDTLFVSVEGAVMPGRLEDHPEHVVSYWRDPFVILDGTGRFAGATGSGMTDDYNSSEDQNSHHHWVGTITMKKGKR